MSKPDKRRVPYAERLPPKVLHDLRNYLSVAVGTADLLLLDGTLDQAHTRDIEKIREACLHSMRILGGPKPSA